MAQDVRHNIKLILIDLDGTLLDSASEISAESRATVKQCARAGIRVVIATARPPRSSRGFYDQLQLDTPSIHYNGALVYDFAQETALLHHPIPGPLAAELSQSALEIDPSAIISLEVSDRWFINRRSEHLVTKTERIGFVPDYVGDLERYYEEPVTKILISFPGAEEHEAEALLKSKFGGRLTFTRSEESLLQVMNGGVSKGMAARFVMHRLGVAKEEAAAIGDAPNDIPMFEVVGLSIAMQNGYPEVRSAADHVTLGNDEDGAAAAIRDLILQPSKDQHGG